MKLLLLLTIGAALALAQSKVDVATTPTTNEVIMPVLPKLTEVQELKRQVIMLTEEKLKTKVEAEANVFLQKLRADEGLDGKIAAFRHEVCDPLNIPLDECLISAKGEITRKPKDQPKP